jgi:hypothetical protein
MDNKFGKIIQEAGSADNLFIGSDGKFIQWSVSQKKVSQVYGQIMDGVIRSMAQISDKNYLFLSDDEGC